MSILKNRKSIGIYDFIVTIFLWLYFTLGALLFFIPQYIIALIFSRNEEEAFQVVNHRFFKLFFMIAEKLCPGLNISIPSQIQNPHPSTHKDQLQFLLIL